MEILGAVIIVVEVDPCTRLKWVLIDVGNAKKHRRVKQATIFQTN